MHTTLACFFYCAARVPGTKLVNTVSDKTMDCTAGSNYAVGKSSAATTLEERKKEVQVEMSAGSAAHLQLASASASASAMRDKHDALLTDSGSLLFSL